MGQVLASNASSVPCAKHIVNKMWGSYYANAKGIVGKQLATHDRYSIMDRIVLPSRLVIAQMALTLPWRARFTQQAWDFDSGHADEKKRDRDPRRLRN